MVGDFPSWALVDGTGKILTVEYHPGFEKLYPRGSKFPCRIIIKGSLPRYEVDWEEVYNNLYEEECEYEFDVISIEEDE